MISVIVPVYNVEEYLPRCLQAISQQSYRDLEIILVDDGSTDGSGRLCDTFAASDSRARVIHQANAGLWAARNTGHDAANGEFLFFPDADDYFHRDTLRILLEAINDGKGYDLALCRITKTERTDEEVSAPEPVRLTEKSRDELYRNLFNEGKEDPFAIFMWNKLFRSSLIRDVRTNPYPRSQDKDYMMRLLLRIENAILVENRLYYWVQRPGSLIHSGQNLRLYNECRSRMCYRNYMTMPEAEKSRYAHYFLGELYVRMPFWLHQAWSSPDRQAVISECGEMVRDTRKAYRKSREIPFLKRSLCLFLAQHPWWTHRLMCLSGN